MAPVKTRSSGRHSTHNSYKADPEDTNDDDDFYGMRELKHQLAGLNLQLKDTTGDGNCLFRACADQYTGSERNHAELRAEVCKYIADNADHFKSFMDNETVEAHVAQMRKNGTYGGNIELVAFARLKKVDIKVYQPGYIFVIEGVDVKKEGSTPGQRPVMHIAYHSWEHYSSIRNIDGPHEGLPEISPKVVLQNPLAKLSKKDPPRPIERQIMKLTDETDLDVVRELLEKYKGNFDEVVSHIFEKAYRDEHGEEEGDKGETPETDDGHDNGNDNAKGENKDKETKSVPSKVKSESDAAAAARDESISNEDKPKQGSADTNTTEKDASPPSSPSPRRSTASPAPPSPSKEARTDTPPPSEPAKGIVPKKRMSSREKKEQAKRNQKLNRKNKGKMDGPSEHSSSTNSPSSSGGGSASSPGSMRELFI
ncbi:hypothetical protein BG006_005776 [Podila minutissima]|uniref:OTU domain-containing protein n=1 Tax=Podila minutissima TaxID=64525 RepID=A0A9P5SJJ5_9FUNG|nr:hypothetical protein BG006_005776 [Podila minutissima]